MFDAEASATNFLSCATEELHDELDCVSTPSTKTCTAIYDISYFPIASISAVVRLGDFPNPSISAVVRLGEDAESLVQDKSNWLSQP